MPPPAQAALAQGVDGAACGLRADTESFGQRVDQFEALGTDQAEDGFQALICCSRDRWRGIGALCRSHMNMLPVKNDP